MWLFVVIDKSIWVSADQRIGLWTDPSWVGRPICLFSCDAEGVEGTVEITVRQVYEVMCHLRSDDHYLVG